MRRYEWLWMKRVGHVLKKWVLCVLDVECMAVSRRRHCGGSSGGAEEGPYRLVVV